MTLILPVSTSTPNLVQIDQELAEICPLYFPRWGHLGFVIRRFWTTHDAPVAGFYVPANGVIISLNLSEIL